MAVHKRRVKAVTRQGLGSTTTPANDDTGKRIPALPADVVFQICKYLITATRTLKSISRTCRVWSYAVRSYIFRRITITDMGSFQRLGKLVEEQPFVLSWIFEICISGRKESFGIPPWFRHLPEVLPSASLPKLCSISFVDLHEAFDRTEVKWDYPMLKETLPLYKEYTSVLRVDFLDCELPYDVLQHVIGAFSNVVEVHFHRSKCSPPNGLASLQSLPLPRQLQSFMFHGTTQTGALALHVQNYQNPPSKFTQAMSTLKTLHYHLGADAWLTDGLGKILYHGTPHRLEHLVLACPEIDVDTWDDNSGSFNILRRSSINNLTNLRTLHFEGSDAASSRPSVIKDLLRMISSPHLRTFALSMSFRTMTDIPNKSYLGVDALLSNVTTFPALTEVRLVYHGNAKEARYTKKLRGLFPKTCERGIVKIVKELHPDELCLVR
ncbi:hypothetical protein EIP91_000491 [Steccherinum ochraceum]|uniref:F-box domain-containing protein n=1 Tax=Steccherinum ochraceum TaxID=92696 RepID=A0A4R0RU36_9APHY|nr:hypothetical protein EIP91_000491 [Steccherinum ochraceum]